MFLKLILFLMSYAKYWDKQKNLKQFFRERNK